MGSILGSYMEGEGPGGPMAWSSPRPKCMPDQTLSLMGLLPA